MQINWETGSAITVKIEANGETVISANRAGLLSLAGILRTLAEDRPGSHLHLDTYNALEDGSSQLVLVRTE